MVRVFVGNLSTDVQESALEGEFDKFGRIRAISLKFPARPPPFAFIVRCSRGPIASPLSSSPAGSSTRSFLNKRGV